MPANRHTAATKARAIMQFLYQRIELGAEREQFGIGFRYEPVPCVGLTRAGRQPRSCAIREIAHWHRSPIVVLVGSGRRGFGPPRRLRCW